MKKPRSLWLWISESRLVAYALMLLALGLLFRSHYRLTLVSGDSMAPTLKGGYVLLIDKSAYSRAEPERDDIIVMRYSNGLVVKRIVGLPGEDVEVRHGTLYVNGSAVEESHPLEPGNLDVEKGNLSSGDFATLGDNRAVPSVLAIHPIATKADILGKVVLSVGKHLF